MFPFLLSPFIGLICLVPAVVVTKKLCETYICNPSEVSDAEKQRMKQGINDVAEKVKNMKDAARESAESLRTTADYLDEKWKNCKTASAMGTTSSIVGGVLTIVGVTATTLTCLSPLVMVGVSLAGVGSLVNLGVRQIEFEINSSQLKEADAALENISQLVDAVRRQIRMLKDGKDSIRLWLVAKLAKEMLGDSHLAVALIKSSMEPGLLAKFMMVKESALKAMSDLAVKFGFREATTATTREIAQGGSKSAALKAAEVVVKRGRIIIGASVVFLVLDAIDLHFTVQDIVKNKGCHASRLLRGKVKALEAIARG